METIFNKKEIMKEVEDVVFYAEALIEATANKGDKKLDELRNKVTDSLMTVKTKLGDAEDGLIARTKASAKAGDTYVHDNPWRSIGFAASVGVVLGLLLGRR